MLGSHSYKYTHIPTPNDLQEGGQLSRHAAVLHRGTTVSGLMLCSDCQDYLRNA